MGNEEKKPSPPTPLPEGEGGRRPGEGNTWSALSLAWELGYTIAVPIVVLALAGRFADRRLGTSPWLLLAGIFVSIVISTISVYFKTIKIIGKNEGMNPVRSRGRDTSKTIL
jgi:F0F1-type ATP synthase assembly protein I